MTFESQKDNLISVKMPLSAAHKSPALYKPTARGISALPFPIFLSVSGTVSECESGEITSSSRSWQGGNENEMNPTDSLLGTLGSDRARYRQPTVDVGGGGSDHLQTVTV